MIQTIWSVICTGILYLMIVLEIVIILGAIKATIDLLDRGHHYIRCFFMILFLLMISCTSQKHYVSQPVKRKDYSETRGLMLFENSQLGRNKYFWSKSNRRHLTKTHNKFHNQ